MPVPARFWCIRHEFGEETSHASQPPKNVSPRVGNWPCRPAHRRLSRDVPSAAYRRSADQTRSDGLKMDCLGILRPVIKKDSELVEIGHYFNPVAP